MRFISNHCGPLKMLLALAALIVATPPAHAQFSDSYNFLKAVKDRKGDDAEKYINEPGSGPVIINTRESGTGQTALHIVTARRDDVWLRYLLAKGANPNLGDSKSKVPLLLATELGWIDGIKLLLASKAQVDAANRSGETALIRAVQLRNGELVRLLVQSGANPDKTDNVSGKSARDYAKDDGRGSAILQTLEDAAKAAAAKKKEGDLNFSGIGDAKPADPKAQAPTAPAAAAKPTVQPSPAAPPKPAGSKAK